MHVLGTCGHVDHGKSSLLRLLTDMEPDRLPEEKKRGMTIDLGFVWMALPDGARIGIVDVPGHQRFVKNMISGTINVDAFLFVVAADDGWMPQSQEHLEILRSLGVRDGLIVISKTDLVDSARVEEVARDVAGRLKAAFGHEFPLVRFSAHDPAALPPLRRAVESLVAKLPPPRESGKARLWIDRVFVPRGLGVVATGTLREGALREGDDVSLWPAGSTAQVKSLQSYHQTVGEARPVTRVALVLAKVQREDVDRGMLLTVGSPGALAKVADARARFFGKRPARNVQVSFHIGTRRERALLIPLGPAGDEFFVRLKFASPVPLREGDRFVLRTSGEDETLGAGTIADPLVESSSHREALAALEAWSPEPAGAVALEARNRFIVDKNALAERTGHGPADLETALAGSAWVALGAGRYAEKAHWEKARAVALAAVAAAHAKKQEAVALKDLRRDWQTKSGLPTRWLERVLPVLAEVGELRRQGEGYLPVASGAKDAAREQKARAWLAKAGGEPASFKAATAEVKKIARELVNSGEWVALADEFYWEASAYAAIRAGVETYLKEKGQATTSDLKAALGLSRKFAVMLFEQLDHDRVTYLKDGVRKLLKSP